MSIHIGDRTSSKEFGHWRNFVIIPSNMPLHEMTSKILKLKREAGSVEITFASYFTNEYVLVLLLNFAGCSASVNENFNSITIK